MFKSLKLCFVFLVTSIIISMPVVHALEIIEQDPMYTAICAYYAEMGLPEENIAGSATEFVRLLNIHANDFQGLLPEQVRYLVHPDVNLLDSLRQGRLMALTITAVSNYGLQLASQSH